MNRLQTLPPRVISLYLATSLLFALTQLNANAEITFDGSAGPQGNLSGQMDISADFGRQAGANLLHSFTTFHVRTGESANFSGPDSVSRIIGRVTGNELSIVQGAITSSIPAVDLYLLNPEGFAINESASINIPGSVYLSSAQTITFGDGLSLATGSTATPATLSFSAPETFGFVSNPAPLQVDGLIRAGRISLVGGELNLTNATLYSPAGRVDLVGLSDGSVNLSGLEPQIDQVGPGADVNFTLESFSNLRVVDGEFRANVDTTGPANGPVFVRGSRLQMDGGFIFADRTGAGDAGDLNVDVSQDIVLRSGARLTTDNKSTSPGAVGGSLILRAGQSLSVTGRSTGIASTSNIEGAGAGGLINIQAPNVSLSEASVIISSSAGNGDAGDIVVDSQRLNIASGARISSTTQGSGAGGSVRITTAELTAGGLAAEANGGAAGIDVSTIGSGNAGSIIISANTVNVNSGASFEATANTNESGTTRGGLLQINADVVEVTGGDLSATTFDAQGGSVAITAANRIDISEQGQIRAETTGAGAGGQIALQAPVVNLNGGFVSATSTARGASGSIEVNAGELQLTDAAITSASLSTESSAGSAGQISITSDSARFFSSIISTDIEGGIDGLAPANVELRISGPVTLDDASQISSNTNGPVRGGEITLAASNILTGGSAISTRAGGVGNSGNIQITAPRGIELSAGASLSTDSAQSQGGNVQVIAGGTSVVQDGAISASAGAAGSGGNLDLDFDRLVLERSELLALADAGNGGRIDLGADAVVQDFASRISADSNSGTAGIVNIVVPESDVSAVIAPQNANIQAVPALLRDYCSRAADGSGSRLVERPQISQPMPEQIRTTDAHSVLGC